MGRYAGESHYRLRGECKDAATAEDVARFPNTIELVEKNRQIRKRPGSGYCRAFFVGGVGR